jgi:L,D-peptidoglycan transpeptidase YkuD (ErfK/YbiS/YcfS/YnhG family)
MGWCDNPANKKYNEEIELFDKESKERFYRIDNKYDYLITISHNEKKIPHLGSAIFLHLTNNYKPTAGCIALKKKDFEVILKLINQDTKIKIG